MLVFFILVTEKTAHTTDTDLENKWSQMFEGPLYCWDLNKKRMMLLLATLARWNPDVSPLYQDQLIIIVGLDVGGSGPNNLRALKIAISRKLGITFLAIGNAHNRLYAFEHEEHRKTVLALLEEKMVAKKLTHLRKELQAHRRRNW